MQNSFSKLVESSGEFDIFRVLLSDVVHDVEIGVWLMIFIHLLRMLDAKDETLKAELDRRCA